MLLITLLVNLFIPLDGLITAGEPLVALGTSILLYLGKVMLMAILMAITEISTVKLRLFSIPNLAALSFILSLLGFFQYLVVGR
jgi:formate hydrogenlyase subunit 4